MLASKSSSSSDVVEVLLKHGADATLKVPIVVAVD